MMVEHDSISDSSNLNDASSIGKVAVEQVEQVNTDTQKPANNDHMPEILRHLSGKEREDLNLRLRKKIDLRLLPMMLVMYIMNYLDRNNIASARLAGLEADLGMDLNSSQFQLSVSILFIGYLLMQVPSNMLLNKFGKPAIYLPICMVVWGVISGLTGAVHNFAGLLVCRFFLGFVEAAYFPGCLFYLSIWYTRRELALRTAVLYSGSLLSGAFSGLIAAGITSGMAGVRGLGAWRWLFIIEGSVTVVVAIGASFIMPNFPKTTSWLTEEEREMAAWRLAEDIGAEDWVSSKEQSIFHGAKLAAADSKAWILLMCIYGFTSSGTVTTFFPIVVKGLGFTNIKTLLLTAPPYLFGTIIVLSNAWHADRTREKYYHVIIGPLFGMIAYIIAVTTTNLGARYFAMMIMIGANYSGYVVALGWISNVLPRPPAKRAAALAGINALSNVCQIYSPFLYPASGAPNYVLAMCFNIGTSVMSIVGATILRSILITANKKLDQGAVIGNDGKMHLGDYCADAESGTSRGVSSSTFRFMI